MKLFITNRQFQGEMEKALAPLKRENEELKEKISKKEYNYLSENSQFKIQIEELLKVNQEHKNTIGSNYKEIDYLKAKIKEINGAKGGLTKYAHRLEKEINELKNKLEEANEKLSKRYIVKELKPVKAKNTQVMKTKNTSKTSKIIKKVVEDD